MELTPKQQAVELIKASKKILLVTHQDMDGDAAGSILAMAQILEKIGKEVAAVCADPVPGYLSFLPEKHLLETEFKGTKDLIIKIDTSKAEVDKVSYIPAEKGNKYISLVVTPVAGSIDPGFVSFEDGSYKYDLIIALDCASLDMMGRIYEENSQVFFETPLINIDHHITNDNYGKINLVDLTATCTAEILVALSESLGKDKTLLDSDIATCLLTGITTDTGSFQNENTTPKSFTVAAQLVAAGARQQEIIRNIYRTKSLSTLKLWGKVLSNVVEETDYGFIWSKVSKKDLSECKAEESQTGGIIDELLKTVQSADFCLLLTEKKNGISASLRSVRDDFDVTKVAQLFGGGGHVKASGFQIQDTNLDEIQNKIIEKIRGFQKKIRTQIAEKSFDDRQENQQSVDIPL